MVGFWLLLVPDATARASAESCWAGSFEAGFHDGVEFGPAHSGLGSLPEPRESAPDPSWTIDAWSDGDGDWTTELDSGHDAFSTAGERAEADHERDPWADFRADSEWVDQSPLLGDSEVPAYPVDEHNARVQYFVDRFTGSQRNAVGAWLGRAGRYLDMIREVLRSRGLPEELAFTAMIESGFNPVAVSRAGAKGLWQFMAATARSYGLRVDQWVDERFDPEKSTVAAAAYLSDLYNQFGSWHLAKAAYNAGEVRVARAVQAARSTDFWTLARSRFLVRETKDFVPQIQAAVIIGRAPERYGFEIGGGPAAPRAEVITVPPSTNLRRLAAAARLEPDAIRSLNPALIRGVTPPGRTYEVRVPADALPRVLEALAPRPRSTAVARGAGGAVVRASANGEVHVVRPRETVSGIAKRYGVSVSDVVRWNRLEQADRIRPGDRLRVIDVRPASEPDATAGSW